MAINDLADSYDSYKAINGRLITRFGDKNVAIADFQNKSVLLTNFHKQYQNIFGFEKIFVFTRG